MKFVSKSTNLYVVLRPSLPGNPMLGTVSTPGLSVRFRDGIVDVKDEAMVEMMKNHPGFGVDFIATEDAGDPYAAARQSSEPGHVVTELKFGTPVARKTSTPTLSPEMAKALELAKAMLPDLLASALKAEKAKEAGSVAPETPEVPVAPAPVAEGVGGLVKTTARGSKKSAE